MKNKKLALFQRSKSPDCSTSKTKIINHEAKRKILRVNSPHHSRTYYNSGGCQNIVLPGFKTTLNPQMLNRPITSRNVPKIENTSSRAQDKEIRFSKSKMF